MRLEGYEVVEELPDRTWLARDADGTLVELVSFVVRENERGEATQRLNRFRKIAHPSLPRVIAVEGDPSVRSELIVVTEHRPRISLARCARASEVGLAVALVCSVACSVARALADLHAARVVHGRIGSRAIAVGNDGSVLLDFPRLVRTTDFRADVDALVRMMCTLITPSPSPSTSTPASVDTAAEDHVDLDPHNFIDDNYNADAYDADDADDAYDADDAEEPDGAHVAPTSTSGGEAFINALISARPDVPTELIDVMRATQGESPLDARGFADALAQALPWTQWTPQNVVDEVRALVPE